MCAHAPEGVKDFTIAEEVTGLGFFGAAKALAKIKLQGKGPMTSSGCEQGCFINTKGEDGPADLQIRFAPAGSPYKDGVSYYKDYGKGLLKPTPGFVF